MHLVNVLGPEGDINIYKRREGVMYSGSVVEEEVKCKRNIRKVRRKGRIEGDWRQGRINMGCGSDPLTGTAGQTTHSPLTTTLKGRGGRPHSSKHRHPLPYDQQVN